MYLQSISQNQCFSSHLWSGSYVVGSLTEQIFEYRTLNQKYTLSCTQTWHDFITGAYQFDSEYNAVSFDTEQPEYATDNGTDISAFALFRLDPVMPVDAECVFQSRNAFMIGLNIFAFVGSMAGLHAVFRTILMWSEPLKNKCTKICV